MHGSNPPYASMYSLATAYPRSNCRVYHIPPRFFFAYCIIASMKGKPTLPSPPHSPRRWESDIWEVVAYKNPDPPMRPADEVTLEALLTALPLLCLPI